MYYEDIRPDLQEGDIVEFVGKGLISWLISIFCGGRSHVGIIAFSEGRVLLFESVLSGVRVTLLSDVISLYVGQIYIRHLIGERTQQMLDDYHDFIKRTLGMPYEKHLIEWIEAATPWHLGIQDCSSWFCSELVAWVFQLWHIISSRPNANQYNPGDFKLGGAVDDELKKYGDPADENRVYCLGTEIPVTKAVAA